MRTFLFSSLFLITFALCVSAQDGKEPGTQPTPVANDTRGEMLREIGLTPEQFRQIRRLNMERRPFMEAAQTKLRDANRLLDEAIYADEVNEQDVQARLKDVQLAQAEVAKIRSLNELAMRRILTPEQLVHFRQLRQRFEQARENIERRRQSDRKDRTDTPKAARPFVKQDQNIKQP